jgi:hypothetical protein
LHAQEHISRPANKHVDLTIYCKRCLSPAVRWAAASVLLAFVPLPAAGHVKWFAPYIVGAPPRPIITTLIDAWFWIGIALVLLFFMATRAVEKSTTGASILDGMDWLTDPLWRRLDDFIQLVIGGFFVAVFAVGGVYLTPDLKTPSEWVSWAQLLIAAGVFSKKTMRFSAAGIIALWVLALRDYDLFHLLDYLALGIGVAAYLVLASSSDPTWRKYRFQALRWGVAIALMWSSLEKFAYPDWFYPLVEEKPFLTFGLPRDVFIPMAGVAEFTMGFGLLWTPLVRRLSAVALFVIFNAAVYPFGRIDLVGHALIMAIIVAIAADHTRDAGFLPTVKARLAGVPAGLTAALLLFATGYWGIHAGIYGPEGRIGAPQAEMATHSHNPEHPHGPQAPGSIGAPPDRLPVAQAANEAPRLIPSTGKEPGSATGEFEDAMTKMHAPMRDGVKHPDPDVAFVLGMLPHHVGAVEMAEVQLRYGNDPRNRKLAEAIISTQRREIDQMRTWLAKKGINIRE